MCEQRRKDTLSRTLMGERRRASASRRLKQTVKRYLAAAAIVALSTIGLVAGVAPAQAASLGVGWDYNATSHLGAYSVGGVNGYCIDPGVPPPLAASSDAGIVTSYTSQGPSLGQNVTNLDSTTLGKVNYLVSTFGQTGNKDQAAAVAMAVATTANPAAYAAHTAPFGDQYYSSYMPAANWNNVKNLVAQYRAAAAAYNPGSGSNSASMTFTVDNNNYQGSLNITALSPSPASGTITLTNGVFANGQSTMSGSFFAGQSIAVTGVPPAGSVSYEISAHADFIGNSGPAGNIHLYTTGSRQGLATPGTSQGANFSADAQDPFDRSALFAPVVTTQATSALVRRGVAPQDTLTFATTNFTDPTSGQTVNNPWPQFADGTYLPLTATGTWYGPFSSPPAQAASVPAGAPIAGHATVTTTAAGGPMTTYTATSDAAATESGYYTWVWTIANADQTGLAQRQMPPSYSFVDQFGQATESQISASTVKFSTQLSASTAVEGDRMTDTITPTLTGGAWLLTAGGQRIPVTLTGDVYFEPTKPVQSSSVPTSATRLGSTTATLTGPTAVTSAPFSIGYQTGFVTVKWSIQQSAQPAQYQGYFDDYADDYGVPAETAQILGPTVVTAAQPTGPVDGIAQDIATVTGPLPAVGIDLTWQGYLRADLTVPATCLPAALTFTSTAPTPVTADGSYPSEPFTTPAGFLGGIDWIETATLHGTSTVLHTGVCGAAGETSISALPHGDTIPPTNVATGSVTHDTLNVNGFVPTGTTAVIRLYMQAKGTAELVCDSTTQVGGALAPIAITAGVAVNAKYLSPDTPTLTGGQYGFVETLLDGHGNVLTVGGCHDELFTVHTLAFTGGPDTTALWAGGGLLTVLVGALAVYLTRRARRNGESA